MCGDKHVGKEDCGENTALCTALPGGDHQAQEHLHQVHLQIKAKPKVSKDLKDAPKSGCLIKVNLNKVRRPSGTTL